jgi:endonuclease YncB( thermonuclease family)
MVDPIQVWPTADGGLSMLMNSGATIAHTIRRLSSVMAIFAMTACLTWSARAETISGRVRPMDGDTFEIADVVIRLADVDAPEKSQKCEGGPKELRNCGAFVADVLAERTRGQVVECEVHALDDYERRLASCSHAGEDLSTWLVSEGLPLAFRRFSERLVPEENAARAAGRGLWQTTFRDTLGSPRAALGSGCPRSAPRLPYQGQHQQGRKEDLSHALAVAMVRADHDHRVARRAVVL